MDNHTPYALRVARRLRGAMSLPEVLLWRALRHRPQGVKFRRQHPLGSFVVDFFCAERGLAVEIDGAVHGMGHSPAHDERRDDWLRTQGVSVLRIPAAAVLADVDAVAQALVARCVAIPPPSAPAGAATSPAGGGFGEVPV